jgi:hypothetical protein
MSSINPFDKIELEYYKLHIGDIIFERQAKGKNKYLYMIIDKGEYHNKSDLRSICYNNDCSITAIKVKMIYDLYPFIEKYNIIHTFLASEPLQFLKEDENALKPRLHLDWITLFATKDEFYIVKKFIQTENEYQI